MEKPKPCRESNNVETQAMQYLRHAEILALLKFKPYKNLNHAKKQDMQIIKQYRNPSHADKSTM